MTIPSSSDDLEPRLAEAEAELFERLGEACALEPEAPGEEDTGELLRLEEVLNAARSAAERAVELRRERRARKADDEGIGVREFRDADGGEWRVWCVVPTPSEGARPLKRVGSEYERGWLAFESLDGTKRRRLPSYPADWQETPDAELAAMLDRATPVAPPKRRGKDQSDAPDERRAD